MIRNQEFEEKMLEKLEAQNEKFWHDLDEESDRAMVLSASAYFEALLGRCIERYMRPGKETAELLKSQSGLGSFSARIKAAFALRIIEEKEADCFKIVARIRNKFAHEILTSFEEGSIGDRVNHLRDTFFADTITERVKNLKDGQPREAFSFTCFCLGMQLSHREVDIYLHTKSYGELIPNHLDDAVNSNDEEFRLQTRTDATPT